MSRVAKAAIAAMVLTALAGANPALAKPAAKPAPAPAAAQTFVKGLYKAYADETYSPIGDAAPRVFDASTLALLRENARLTPEGELGSWDADPICRCQDPTGVTAVITASRSTGKGTAVVTVDVRFGEQTQGPVTFRLVATGAGWRVHDLESDEIGSLRGYTQDENARLRRGEPR